MVSEKKATATKTAPKTAKTVVKLGEMLKVDKEMPTNIGKGNKYNFLSTMAVGSCVCLPPGSTNVSNDVLTRAIQGAARRYKVKIVMAVDSDGFNIWRTA